MLNTLDLKNLADIPSPSVLVDYAQLLHNIDHAIEKVGGRTQRLWPHIKTHKSREIIQLHQDRRVEGFKCATIAEAELLGRSGVKEVLVACQPTGLNQSRILTLVKAFPATQFHAVIDNQAVARSLAALFSRQKETLSVFIDVDCGMKRTGIEPGKPATELCSLIDALNGLTLHGAHLYEGHINASEFNQRNREVAAVWKAFDTWSKDLVSLGLVFKKIVMGGSPTFSIHAQNPEVVCSPGTYVFWDAGYQSKYTELTFLPAAYLLSRVVSIPGPDLLCLDAGTKSLASEMPQPRLVFPEMPDARIILQSEEHMVLRVQDSSIFQPGDSVLGIPWHICPTVALHQCLYIVKDQRIDATWDVAARNRVLSI